MRKPKRKVTINIPDKLVSIKALAPLSEPKQINELIDQAIKDLLK